MTKTKGFRLGPIDQLMLQVLAKKQKTNQTQIVKQAIRYYYSEVGKQQKLPDEVELICQVAEVGYQKRDE